MKTDYNKLFWKVAIVTLLIIGINHASSIYVNYVGLKKLAEYEDFNKTYKAYYNDGVEIGWRSALLKVSGIMKENDQDFSIPLSLSKDSTQYQNLYYKK